MASIKKSLTDACDYYLADEIRNIKTPISKNAQKSGCRRHLFYARYPLRHGIYAYIVECRDTEKPLKILMDNYKLTFDEIEFNSGGGVPMPEQFAELKSLILAAFATGSLSIIRKKISQMLPGENLDEYTWKDIVEVVQMAKAPQDASGKGSADMTELNTSLKSFLDHVSRFGKETPEGIKFLSPIGASQTQKHWSRFLSELKKQHDRFFNDRCQTISKADGVVVSELDFGKQQETITDDYAAIHQVMVQVALMTDNIDCSAVLNSSDIDFLKKYLNDDEAEPETTTGKDQESNIPEGEYSPPMQKSEISAKLNLGSTYKAGVYLKNNEHIKINRQSYRIRLDTLPVGDRKKLEK